MKVESLQIASFRNIKEIKFVPCEGANIIFGDNAQGKTNLLEAIWLFSGAKSFRGAKDSEFTRFGSDSARLDLLFSAGNREQTASIRIENDKKSVLLNEIRQESVTKLAGEFCAVVFSPDHLSLVKQGPEKRRKFVDISLCQTYPKYIRILDGYQKSLRQRNCLLKDIREHPSLLDTLCVWDKNILEYGAYITSMRARYVKKLIETAKKYYAEISSGKEEFSAVYIPGFDTGDIELSDRDRIRQKLEREMENARENDIRQGTTSLGPHRDDVEILVNGVSARSFGSQGQQRSCILALKLAECGILEERNNEPPVILFDDVMSELDHSRRDFLLNQLQGKQTFITCCDAGAFESLEQGKIFEIKAGGIV